jgi:hypothetical protein
VKLYESIVSEVWNEIKRYINTVERREAAETLVSVLIDNDSNPEDIHEAFKGDLDVKLALAEYFDTDQDSDHEDDYLDGIDDPDY